MEGLSTTGGTHTQSDKSEKDGAAAAGGSSEKNTSTYFKKLRALFDKLGSNDEHFTSIDFCKQRNLFAYCWDDDELFGELLGILRTNTVITKIDIDPSLLRRLPTEQVFVFYEAIGSLENLEELNFTSLSGSSSVLDVELLSMTLQRCGDRLLSLRLHSMRPNGDNEDDLQQLQSTIKDCSALEKFEMFITATTTNIDLDQFVRSFCLIPNLLEIRLISSLRKRTAWMSGETIKEFTRMPKLKKLTLRNQRLLSDHINFLVDALVSGEGPAAAAAALAANAGGAQGRLKGEDDETDDDDDTTDDGKDTPGIEYLDVDGNNLGDYGAVSLAKLLRAPTLNCNYVQTITELDLSDNWIGDPGIYAIADALTYNKTLQYLNIQKNYFSEDGYHAVITMMQKNYYIEELEVDTVDTPEYILDQIDFYLQLNGEVGRKNLLRYPIEKEDADATAKLIEEKLKLKKEQGHGPGGAREEEEDMKQSYDEEEEEQEVEEEVVEEMSEPEDEDDEVKHEKKRKMVLQPIHFGHPLPDTTRQDYLDAIENNMDELSCIYYLFRANPAICDLESGDNYTNNS